MRHETVFYAPRVPPFALAEITKDLPEWIVEKLITGPHRIYVELEAKHTKAVAYLDEAFEIGTTRRFCKREQREIDKEEIDEYDFFLIAPHAMEVGRSVFTESTRPTCQTEACPVGSELILPVRVTKALARRLGITEIGRAWGQESEMLISAELKRLFDESGITGLDYARCVIEKRGAEKADDVEAPFLARPNYLVTDQATAIFSNWSTYCEDHAVIFAFYLEGRSVTRHELEGKDFIGVEGVIVDGKHYHYRTHRMIVSRRALNVFLENKVRGLDRMGRYLDQRFIPIMPRDADVPLYNYF